MLAVISTYPFLFFRPAPVARTLILLCSPQFSENRQNFFSKLRSLLDTMQESERGRWVLCGWTSWPDQKCLNFYRWKLIALGKATPLQVCSPTRFNFHEGKEHASITGLHPHIPLTLRSKWITRFPSLRICPRTNTKSYGKPIISGSVTGGRG